MHVLGFELVYNLAWGAALPLLATSTRLRQGWRERVWPSGSRGRADIWVQASSAGEAYLAAHLSRECLVDTRYRTLITCSTTQGIQVLKRVFGRAQRCTKSCFPDIGYFPFDMPFIMRRALDTVQPKVVVTLETELWPGLLSQCKRRGIPILLLNGRLSEGSLKRYLHIARLWRANTPTKILAVSKEDAMRFQKLFPGCPVGLMKNMKFDRVSFERPAFELPESLIKNLRHPLIVLGSVRKEEERDVLEAVKGILANTSEATIALFPRHMYRIREWIKLLRAVQVDFTLRSKTGRAGRYGRVILWDIFGEMDEVYRIADAVFVGGTLRPCGGQNFLEPLASGLIPCIGPYWDNFAWVGRDIVVKGLVKEVRGVKELVDELLRGINEKRPREEVIGLAERYIRERQGGTKQACHELRDWL